MFQPKTSFHLIPAALLLIAFSSANCLAQENSAPDSAPPATPPVKRLPLSGSSAATYQSYDAYREVARQQIRERVQFEARQRVLREERNQWIGYSPARPTVNASNLSNGLPYYYVPSRGQIVTTGMGRAWYW